MGCGEGSDGVTPKPTAQRPARGAKPLGPGAIHSSDNVVLCVCACASGDLSCFGGASKGVESESLTRDLEVCRALVLAKRCQV